MINILQINDNILDTYYYYVYICSIIIHEIVKQLSIMAYLSLEERLEDAKTRIENGAKFNGVVYRKSTGRNMDFSIYLNNEYVNLGRLDKDHATKYRKVIEAALCVSADSFPKTNSSLKSYIPKAQFSGMVNANYSSKAISEINDFHRLCEGED